MPEGKSTSLSLSRHAYMIGCDSGEVVRVGVLRKKIATYSRYNKQDPEHPIHQCTVNHDTSSGVIQAKFCCTLLDEYVVNLKL